MSAPFEIVSWEEWRERWWGKRAGRYKDGKLVDDGRRVGAFEERGRSFDWECPNCGEPHAARLGDAPISGWESPQWVLSGTPGRPTLTPSLGCGFCWPVGHYWLRDGEMVPA